MSTDTKTVMEAGIMIGTGMVAEMRENGIEMMTAIDTGIHILIQERSTAGIMRIVLAEMLTEMTVTGGEVEASMHLNMTREVKVAKGKVTMDLTMMVDILLSKQDLWCNCSFFHQSLSSCWAKMTSISLADDLIGNFRSRISACPPNTKKLSLNPGALMRGQSKIRNRAGWYANISFLEPFVIKFFHAGILRMLLHLLLNLPLLLRAVILAQRRMLVVLLFRLRCRSLRLQMILILVAHFLVI